MAPRSGRGNLRDVDEQVYLPKAVRGLLYVGQDDPELLFG
jgi:hypothetical protein